MIASEKEQPVNIKKIWTFASIKAYTFKNAYYRSLWQLKGYLNKKGKNLTAFSKIQMLTTNLVFDEKRDLQTAGVKLLEFSGNKLRISLNVRWYFHNSKNKSEFQRENTFYILIDEITLPQTLFSRNISSIFMLS